eukprot:g18607.t1
MSTDTDKQDWTHTDGDEISYIAGSNNSAGLVGKMSKEFPLESSVSTDGGAKRMELDSGGLNFKDEILDETRAVGRAEGRAESEALMKASLDIYREDYAATVSGLEAAHQEETAAAATKPAEAEARARKLVLTGEAESQQKEKALSAAQKSAVAAAAAAARAEEKDREKVRDKRQQKKTNGSGSNEGACATPEKRAGSQPAGLEISPSKKILLEHIGQMMDQRMQRIESAQASLEAKIERREQMLVGGTPIDPNVTADFGHGYDRAETRYPPHDRFTSRDRRRGDRGLPPLPPRGSSAGGPDDEGPGAARGPRRVTDNARYEPEANVDKLQHAIDGLNEEVRDIHNGTLPAEAKAVQESTTRKVVRQLHAIRNFRFITSGRDTGRFIRGTGGSRYKVRETPTHGARGASAVGAACHELKAYQNSREVTAFRYYGRRDGLTQE